MYEWFTCGCHGWVPLYAGMLGVPWRGGLSGEDWDHIWEWLDAEEMELKSQDQQGLDALIKHRPWYLVTTIENLGSSHWQFMASPKTVVSPLLMH